MRWRRIAAVLAVMAALAAVGYAALRYLNLDAARALVPQRLEAITGRELAITGDFDLVPALAPPLAAEGAVVANAEWASETPMLEAERIEVELQHVPLLWEGSILIEHLAISGADVLLETGAGDRATWRFGPPAPKAVEGQSRDFLLNDVTIEDSRMRWRDLESEQVATLAITAEPRSDLSDTCPDRWTWAIPRSRPKMPGANATQSRLGAKRF